MKFLKDECGQGAAEMVLLFGGIIVIATVAVAFYNSYTKGIGAGVEEESDGLTENITALTQKF